MTYKSCILILTVLGLISQSQALFDSSSTVMRYFLTKNNNLGLLQTPISDLQPRDNIYSILDLTKKNSKYNMTQVIETFKNTDPKITEISSTSFELEIQIPFLVSDNQCLLVQRRGKDVITNERADKLKEGDFLLMQLNAGSNSAKPLKITKIVKQKVDQSKMVGIKTKSSFYIANLFLVSDKENNCGNLSYKPNLMSEHINIEELVQVQSESKSDVKKHSLKQKVKNVIEKVKEFIKKL
eukprot:403374079